MIYSEAFDGGNKTIAPMMFLVMLLMLGLFVLAQVAPMVAAPKIPMVGPGSHAGAKHGTEALQAIRTVNGSRFCRWDCNDGRQRYVCRGAENMFAIVVMEGARVVTAFMSTQMYATGITTDPGCKNPWRMLAH